MIIVNEERYMFRRGEEVLIWSSMRRGQVGHLACKVFEDSRTIYMSRSFFHMRRGMNFPSMLIFYLILFAKHPRAYKLT